VVNDGAKFDGLPFSRLVKVQRMGKGSGMSESADVVITSNKTKATVRE
jgi:hypothetical protein